MAKENKQFKISGLNNYSDVFSSAPEGSLTVAENVVIDQKNILSPRRGYEKLTLDKSTTGEVSLDNSESLFSFNGKIHFQKSTGELYYYDDTNLVWVEYPNTIVKPTDATRSRIVETHGNTYMTSQNGIQKISSLGSAISDSGAPQALSATDALLPGVTIPANSNVAYRILWGIKDENSNLILGAPSQRLVTGTTGSTQNIELTFRIPESITTEWFYQIYRSRVTADPASPSDELFLVFEGNPSPAQITGKEIIHEDLQPEDLLGTPLYTNATQEGPANANYEAPQSIDVALFQGHVFYGNTQRKSEIIIQLTGTGTDGLQDTDTITIDGTVYTAKTTPAVATDFKLVDNGGTSPSQDVEDTAKNLISAINNNDASNVVAYYWSEVGTDSFDLAGEIRIVEKDFNLAENFIVSATGTNVINTWTPDLVAPIAAETDKKPNRVYYSKFQEPEAVPLANYFDVGPSNSRILRIMPLRTSILIFTEREIYRLTGTTQSAFQVNLLDNTTRLIAEDSAVVFNNAVYGLFDQGVCQVSESVQVISRPIEGDLLKILGATGDNLNTLAYGVGYESERKYILYTPVTASDTASASKAFVYNTVTESWTTWQLPRKHGILDVQTDKLVTLNTHFISRERKDFNDTDIAEEQVNATASVVSGATITLDGAAISAAEVGFRYSESNSKFSKILEINDTLNTITVEDDLGWLTSTLNRTGTDWTIGTSVISNVTDTQDIRLGAIVTGTNIPANSKVISITGDVITINKVLTSTETGITLTLNQTYDVLPAVEVLVEWNPFYMDSPGTLKQFTEATLLTTSPLEKVSVGFKGVTSGSFEDIDFSANVIGAWGLFEWGNTVWGGDAQVLRYRTYIPREKQRDSALYARVQVDAIGNLFEISGFSVMYRELGSRTRR